MADATERAEAEARRAGLEAEWEHQPVPQEVRKPLLSVSLVWLGFPMILTGVVTGALIVSSLGFKTGLVAIVLGNLFLFGYVGALSALGARTGLSFALLSRTVFGDRGYLLASGLLATLVIGWFAVQTGLTADTLDKTFGWNVVLLSVIAGLLYTAVTLFGVRALTVLGAVSAPLFVAFGIYAVVVALQDSGVSAVVGYGGGDVDASAATVGAAVALVVGLFIDSGTMTADFTRWAQTRRHAWVATFSAFPFANGLAMLFGGIVAAAAANTDLFNLIASQGGVIAAVAVVFLFLNLGTVCAHCLYNAAVGWAHFLGRRFREVALGLGIIGTLIAASGAWGQFTNWLILLGVIVPPIGAVVLTDHFVLRRHAAAASLDNLPAWRIAPIAAWAVGAATALIAHFAAPQLSVVVVGFLSASVALVVLVNTVPAWGRVQATDP